MMGTTRRITIACYRPALGSAEYREIMAEVIDERWAIHDDATTRWVDTHPWALTAIPSGRALAWFRTREDALGAAGVLTDPAWTRQPRPRWKDLPPAVADHAQRVVMELGGWTPQMEVRE